MGWQFPEFNLEFINKDLTVLASQRIKATRGPVPSTTTKSAGNWNFPTFTKTSQAIPIDGNGIDALEVGVTTGQQQSNFGSDLDYETEFEQQKFGRLGASLLAGGTVSFVTSSVILTAFRSSDW
ncbi:hypothetical protein Tco_0528922 [Tanacetum coccineum]